MRLLILAGLVAATFGTTGCGSNQSEVPKNPVPIGAPGGVAQPEGGKSGKANPGAAGPGAANPGAQPAGLK
jgi:hypothetical protein